MFSLAPETAGKRQTGALPRDEPRGECVIKWIPLKARCLSTSPRNRPGSPVCETGIRGVQ